MLSKFFAASIKVDLYDLEGAVTALRHAKGETEDVGFQAQCDGAIAALAVLNGRDLRDQSDFMRVFTRFVGEENDDA